MIVNDIGFGILLELCEGLFLWFFIIGGVCCDGGLGLCIVYWMLELNGSCIELLDMVEVGVRFRFCLLVVVGC